jgi:dTMP kinase
MAAAFDALLSLPRTLTLGSLDLTYTGAMVTYLLAGVAMAGAGVGAWRSMNDRPGVSLVTEYRETRRRRRSPS